MASVDQLKAALIQAHNAGDTDAANLFASKIKQMQGGDQNALGSGAAGGGVSNVEVQPNDQAVGSSLDGSSGDGGLDPLGVAKNAALELMAGVNRGVYGLPSDLVDAVSQIAGSDFRMPRPGQQGGFIEDPTARQVLGMAGEFAAPAGLVAKPLKAAVTSRAAKEAERSLEMAVKAGLPSDVAKVASTASGGTKTKLGDQLNIVKKGIEDINYRATNRPQDVIGKSLWDRIKFIDGEGEKLASELNGIVKKELGDVTVDTAPITSDIRERLSELGVSYVPAKSAAELPKLSFAGSVIQENPAAKKAIKSLVKVASFDGPVPARRLHNLKIQIDDIVDYGKGASGLAGKGEGVLNDIRRDVNSQLREISSNYAGVNDKLSSILDAKGQIQSLAGKRIKGSDKASQRTLGSLARRITSNAQSSGGVEDAFAAVDDVANSLGGKFNDDIISQVNFSKALGDLFPDSTATTLKSESRGIAEAATEVATGSGVVGTLKEAGRTLSGRKGKLTAAEKKEILRKFTDLVGGQ